MIVPELEPGLLHRVQSRIDNPGGKGINVSLALVELGAATTALGFLGGDSGRWLENAVRCAGVSGAWVPIAGETRVNIKVRETNSGRVTELNEAGPEILPAEWEQLKHKVAELKPMSQEGGGQDAIVFAGNPPKGLPDTVYAELISLAKGNGLYTVLDTSGRFLAAGLGVKPHLVKPNLEELETLIGTELDTLDSVIQAASELVKSGIQTVVVSMGADGALYCTSDEGILVRPPKVKVNSTVGCGDALVAGTVFAISRGLSLKDTARWGAACGTAAATTEGTQPGPRELVIQLLHSVKVEKVG